MHRLDGLLFVLRRVLCQQLSQVASRHLDGHLGLCDAVLGPLDGQSVQVHQPADKA